MEEMGIDPFSFGAAERDYGRWEALEAKKAGNDASGHRLASMSCAYHKVVTSPRAQRSEILFRNEDQKQSRFWCAPNTRRPEGPALGPRH